MPLLVALPKNFKNRSGTTAPHFTANIRQSCISGEEPEPSCLERWNFLGTAAELFSAKVHEPVAEKIHLAAPAHRAEGCSHTAGGGQSLWMGRCAERRSNGTTAATLNIPPPRQRRTVAAKASPPCYLNKRWPDSNKAKIKVKTRACCNNGQKRISQRKFESSKHSMFFTWRNQDIFFFGHISSQFIAATW